MARTPEDLYGLSRQYVPPRRPRCALRPGSDAMATHAQPDSSTFQAKQVGDERFAHLPTPGDVVEG